MGHDPATEPQSFTFSGDGRVPNNGLPLLLYRKAARLDLDDPAGRLEDLFTGNGWTDSWRNGIFPYHHYHSLTHEVLGIAQGHGRVRFGGENGQDFDVNAGDVVVIPAGVGHMCIEASEDFLVVGAYPPGCGYDLIKADPAAYEAARTRIAKVPKPGTDPLTGTKGGLLDAW
ncbi:MULTISPECIES: cupin domain-containing protein [unclassified Chelatococcus]|nr:MULTISPECIES: cupin domain-containing protein [unclassified Chelatococcus]MBS7697817.1 cupin domain-containing protein [Chelatococcus sp. YT9]MBX3559756.1 cupin domain-containing protein [Chelatococcus sp.]